MYYQELGYEYFDFQTLEGLNDKLPVESAVQILGLRDVYVTQSTIKCLFQK